MEDANYKASYVQEHLKIRHVGNSSLYELYFDTGGKVPILIAGAYTSTAAAKSAINLYILKKSKPKRAYRKRS